MGFLYYYSQRNTFDKEIYQQIYLGLCSYAPKIRINKTSKEKAFEIYQDVLNDHPELSVIDPSEVNAEYSITEFWILPGYWFPEHQVYNNHMLFLDECTFIANRITNSQANELQKEIAIHDFMVRNIRYGLCDKEIKISEKLSQSVFSTLFERKGVCKGISMLFKCLADLVGLNVMVIEGEVFDTQWAPHAWNLINIDGKFFHVDLTQDIVTYQNEGICIYNGLNMLDAEMFSRYRWNKAKYPKCIGSPLGFYEYEKLIVHDEVDLCRELKKQINQRKSVLYFRVMTGSILSCKTQDEIAEMVVNSIADVMNKNVSIRYIFDKESGKCVVEVQ